MTENGVTLNVSVQPAAPQVGDTVTISFSAEAGGEVCCWTTISGPNSSLIYDDLYRGAGCPTPSATSSGSATVQMTVPADFIFRVSAMNGHPCQGAPTAPYPVARVSGSFWVNPLP